MTFVRLLVVKLLVQSGQNIAAAVDTTAAEVTIVTLGDSITKGVRTGVTDTETFSAVIQRRLREHGINATVINKGIGGERTDQALKRLSQIIALKPNIVTVMYGTNDSYVDKGKSESRLTPAAYRSNLVEIIRRLRDADIRPVLMTEPSYAVRTNPNGLGEHPNLRLTEFMAICREVARQQNVTLIDQFEDWTTAEANGQILQEWTTDGCHPNPQGHLRMAGLMEPVLQQILEHPDSQAGAPVADANLRSGGEPVTIVCFGDSVTGLYYHTGGRRAYTDLLQLAIQRVYPSAEVTTFNAGISGNTTRDGLTRIDADVLAKKPSVVTVMFGLNDITRVTINDYRANLLTIVEKIRGAGAEVVLCTPNSVITTASRPTEKLEQYCDVVREIAREHSVTLCDCYAAYQHLRRQDAQAWRLLMSDEIHPNCNGHKRIAEQIAETISGQEVSLTDVVPLRPAIPHTFAKLRERKSVKVLAMPPFDESIKASIQEIAPEVPIDVIPWSVDGMSLSELEQDAKTRVRQLRPDLVIISPPRDAMTITWEEFVKSYAWIMNWSLSFGRQEWDIVVVHPTVSEPQDVPGQFDDLIRQLVNAQDLTLIDRPNGVTDDAAAVVARWLRNEWNAQE